MPHCELCGTPRGSVVTVPGHAAESAAAAGGPAVPATVASPEFFQSATLLPQHLAALVADRDAYFSELSVALSSGTTVNAAVRARALAAAWAVGEKLAFEDMLSQRELFGVNEVLKAAQVLDAPRASRQLAGKLERVRPVGSAAKVGKLETDLTNARAEMVPPGTRRLGSVSRPFTKRVARWAASFPADTLEFFLLSFPTAPWRALADLCHLKPAHFALPYFLPACFSDDAVPADSLVGRGRRLTPENLAEMLVAEPRFFDMYSFVRKAVEPARFSVAAKRLLAARCPLGEVVWWFHELEHPDTVVVLSQRLAAGESVDNLRYSMNFGKLMERLLTFTEKGFAFSKQLLPLAEARLSTVTFPRSDVRVAVMGDASGSMEVAVKTATILGGLLSCCLSAELVFFNADVLRPSVQPRSAVDVVRVAHETRASGSTCPAAALRPFVRARTPLDLIIMVSDEEENRTSEGRDFAELFEEYRATVAPGAQVFFCSFLRPGVKMSQMQVALARRGVPSRLFPFSRDCPDLTKFDSLLATIARLAKGFTAVGAGAAAAAAAPAAGGGEEAVPRLVRIGERRQLNGPVDPTVLARTAALSLGPSAPPAAAPAAAPAAVTAVVEEQQAP